MFLKYLWIHLSWIIVLIKIFNQGCLSLSEWDNNFILFIYLFLEK